MNQGGNSVWIFEILFEGQFGLLDNSGSNYGKARSCCCCASVLLLLLGRYQDTSEATTPVDQRRHNIKGRLCFKIISKTRSTYVHISWPKITSLRSIPIIAQLLFLTNWVIGDPSDKAKMCELFRGRLCIIRSRWPCDKLDAPNYSNSRSSSFAIMHRITSFLDSHNQLGCVGSKMNCNWVYRRLQLVSNHRTLL